MDGVDTTIYTDRKHWPGCKTLFRLLCHTYWCKKQYFCIWNDPTNPLRCVVHEKTKAHSTFSGNYFLGNNIKYGKQIFLNDSIHTLCKIIETAASAAEAKLGSLFLNTQETVKLHIYLQEIGHTQPPTPIHTDNTTVIGIIHKTINNSDPAQWICLIFGK